MANEKQYFNDLNYSLANEDTTLEVALCDVLRPKKVLSVCGSGGRFLPLLKCNPEKIVALDLAQEQLWLAKLREAVIRQFNFQDFIVFWGFPPVGVDAKRMERERLFNRLDLSEEVRAYFQAVFHDSNYSGLLYEGKWERTITGIPKFIKKITRNYYDQIFDFRTMDEQKKYFDSKLDSFVWKIIPRLVLLIFGNAAFFNSFLYKGNFVKKNVPEGYYDFYRHAFKRLFYNGLVRENFFLQLCFLGEIRFAEGCPVEANESVFTACKHNLMKGSKIELWKKDVIQFARDSVDNFDFVSLSDVPSYFKGATERDYMQSLKKCLNPGALVVTRCYLRVPEGTNLEGYTDVTSEYLDLIEKEKTQMYRVFCYKFTP